MNVAYFAAVGEIEGLRRPRDHAGKRVLVVADLLPDRIRRALPQMSRRGRTKFNERQLLGILHRQHAQHHRVDQTENRRVRANAQRERE